MKQTFCFFILLGGVLWACNGGSAEPEGGTPANESFTPAHILRDYQLVWADEFEGTAVNTAKWNYRCEGTVRKNATVSRNT
ncbi:MAG: hypothetical protein AB2L24_00870 [Mangrovibacterium sp.]